MFTVITTITFSTISLEKGGVILCILLLLVIDGLLFLFGSLSLFGNKVENRTRSQDLTQRYSGLSETSDSYFRIQT